jgi:hypothetical protein
MPEICRFFGIIIRMFYDDHQPPHFHAYYGEEQMVVDIRRLAVLAGRLSPRATGLVMEWATLHQADLMTDWERARDHQALHPIDPLN